MKFLAKVKLNSSENTEILLRAFFEEFNERNRIEIKENEATLEVNFQNPPKKLIEAISKSTEIVEFSYCYELDNIKTTISDECKPHPNKRATLPARGRKKSNSEEKNKTPELDKTKEEYTSSEEATKIPELDRFAEESTSYKNFIERVAASLNFRKKKENTFIEMVTAASNVDKITWKKIEENCKNRGIKYSYYDRTSCSSQIAKKFGESVSILEFIKALVEYKEYDFNKKVEETVSAKKVKMECIPNIQYFDRILISIDKEDSIDAKIEYVLNSMNNNNTSETKRFSKIIKSLFDLEDLSVETFNETVSNEIRMDFSKFINDFVKIFNSNLKVKTFDFIKELKEILC